MKMLSIHQEESKNEPFRADPECKEVVDVYPAFYARVGFHPPWIGYFFVRDKVIVGCGGYKGPPTDNKVEIAYGTFKAYQGLGNGTEICRQLVKLALQTDPEVRIMARTLPGHHASINVLEKNGFEFTGMVWDPEDGEVEEWEYRKRERHKLSDV